MATTVQKCQELYNTHYQKIKMAVDNTKTHPCSKILDKIKEAEEYLKRLPDMSSDWDDSAKEAMNSNIQTCLDNLSTAKSSIENNWKKSETLYSELLELLNNLNTETNNLNNLLNNPPIKSHYEIVDALGNVSYSGYNSAYDNWNNKCETAKTKCNTTFDEINNKLNELNTINGELFTTMISISGLGSITPNCNNLISYSFNGAEYLIIDTNNGGYEGVLKRIGEQRPDKCLDWSNRYATSIYNNSESVKPGVYSGLTSVSEDEILRIAANEILNGNPSIIQVNGKNGSGSAPSESNKIGRHFVTVVGIKEEADLNNLQQSDFLILDPAAANIKQLNTKMGRLTTRSLLPAEYATTRKNNNNYIIAIYSNSDNYLNDASYSQLRDATIF